MLQTELFDRVRSNSRPRVSNDSPCSESQFKTLKYRPDYPDSFASLQAARAWCRNFFTWYNNAHYHSGIAYLRPADLHAGRHDAILGGRQAALDKAHAANPQRFNLRPKPTTPPQQSLDQQTSHPNRVSNRQSTIDIFRYALDRSNAIAFTNVDVGSAQPRRVPGGTAY